MGLVTLAIRKRCCVVRVSCLSLSAKPKASTSTGSPFVAMATESPGASYQSIRSAAKWASLSRSAEVGPAGGDCATVGVVVKNPAAPSNEVCSAALRVRRVANGILPSPVISLPLSRRIVAEFGRTLSTSRTNQWFKAGRADWVARIIAPADRLPRTRPWYSGPTMVGAGTDRTRPRLGGGPAVILVRPQLAVNIGMCARAMANFGLDDLRLVNPRQGWPRADEYRDVAYSAAAGATDLLDAARVFPTVEAAIGDLHAIYAATARERGQMKAVLSPSAAMGATAAAVGEKRGILFGPERTGLDNDEVAVANSIITFPSSPTYASLNLSQAVLLCGYEWFKAAHGDAPPPTIPRVQSPPAQREMLLAFFDFLEGKLEEK